MKHNRIENGGSAKKLLSALRSSEMIFIVAALIIGLISGTGKITDGLEQFALSSNILAAYEAPSAEHKAVIIMCTDNTLDNLPEDTGWPIDRSYYTKLLREDLSKSDLVVFDILFSSPSEDEQTDADFASAIREHGNVILPRSESEVPTGTLLDSGARIGYAIEFDEKSSDAVSRRYKLYLNSDTHSGMTLIGAALTELGYKIDFNGRSQYSILSPEGKRISMSVDDEGFFYRVPVKHSFDVPVIDLYDVYTGRYAEGLFDDAYVFIGGTVAGYEDIVFAPDFRITDEGVSKELSTRVIGTKFLVDSYYTVLRGFSPQRLAHLTEGIICALLFLISALITVRLSPRLNWLPMIIFGICWAAASRILFTSGICYLPMVTPLLSIIIAYLLCLVINLRRTSHEWQVSSLPIETLHHMTYDLESVEECSSFEEFVHTFLSGVFLTLGVTLIKAQAIRDVDFEKIIPEKINGTKIIRTRSLTSRHGVDTLVVIPLPSFSENDRTYTVLGTHRKPSDNWVQSVTALILSMYVYYTAQRQSAEKQEMAMSMIRMIIQMIDAKDPVTAGHSRRVSQYSRNIAQWLGYDRKRVSDVEFAALLHDIGKIGVEDAVLNKPGLFTAEDRRKMNSHPSLGADIVRTVGLSDEIVDGVLHHHERADGRGYPSAITGGECSEFAKIIKVADVFDALICKRQYKSAWDEKRAFDIIYNGAGTEFDELIAMTFIKNAAPEDYTPSSSDSDRALPDSRRIGKAVTFAEKLCIKALDALSSKRSSTDYFSGDFSFDCSKYFASVEWGERFSSEVSLALTPTLLGFDSETESIISALRGRNGIDDIIMYYHKGCLSAGVITLSEGYSDKAEKALSMIYSEPLKNGGITVWRSNFQIIAKLNIDGNDIIAYVTNYLANEL